MSKTAHTRWVRVSHWIVTLSFLTLAFTGVVILMAHPRLYWGEVGNNLTPALIELPISRNHRHGGWEKSRPLFQDAAAPVTANRTYSIFNQNGWGRSLHFLAAWFLALSGAIYLLAGIFTGHFRRHLTPRLSELRFELFWREVRDHMRLRIRAATGGPQYGLLQKSAYFAVVFLALPLSVLTGLAMSPAITAAFPFLSRLFGGFQTARTIHFFAFVALMLFLLAHMAMIVKSGFRRQMRAMTIGK
jgi:thiosulfate reductase cytochrome b subunit